jgi:integrase
MPDPGRRSGEAGRTTVLSIAKVVALAEAMEPRYRALVLLTTFACLRWGEVSALQRQDLDTDQGLVRIRQQFTEVRGVGLLLGPPKSRAGVRALPSRRRSCRLRDHLVAFVADHPDALVFTGPTGAPIWRGNFNKLVRWSEAVAAIGASGLHFHDLRHTGNTIAARASASTRELTARMGHDSSQAAIIYQHATAEVDRAIAQAVDEANQGRTQAHWQGRRLGTWTLVAHRWPDRRSEFGRTKAQGGRTSLRPGPCPGSG